MYLPAIDRHTGELRQLRMTPFRIQRMRLARTSPADAAWLRDRIHLGSRRFSAAVELGKDGTLALR
jgi:hypothetical protein